MDRLVQQGVDGVTVSVSLSSPDYNGQEAAPLGHIRDVTEDDVASGHIEGGDCRCIRGRQSSMRMRYQLSLALALRAQRIDSYLPPFRLMTPVCLRSFHSLASLHRSPSTLPPIGSLRLSLTPPAPPPHICIMLPSC